MTETRHRVRHDVAAASAWIALIAAGCAMPTPRPDVVLGEGARYASNGYAHSIAAVGWPGAKRAFQVGHGSVVSTGECAIEWRLVSAGDSAFTTPVRFERDGVPIAHWEMGTRSADAAAGRAAHRVRFEAAAAPVVALGDTSLLMSVVAAAEATGDQPVEVILEARIRALPEGPHAVPWDAPPSWQFDEFWRSHAAYRNGWLVAVVDRKAKYPDQSPTQRRPAHADGPGVGRLIARYTAKLEPGATRQWRFWLPLYPTPLAAADLQTSAAHERVAEASRQHWREWLASTARIESDNESSWMDDLWRAALVNLGMCHEREDGRWIPIGNPFQYRDVWIRDGARVVRAMALAGLSEYAADGARTLAEFQLPSGVLISQRGQLDGTGQALWAFDQASAFPENAALARELLPVAKRALGWIERQRQATRDLDLEFGGLLPFGDPRDAELVRAQLVGNDAWGIAGCDAVAALAQRAGDDSLAARAAAIAADYRATFAAALQRVRDRDVPPSWQGVGRDWGNVAVGYPTRALPFDDPRIAAMATRLRARAARLPRPRAGSAASAGAPPGLITYGSRDSLHSYYGGDLAFGSLLAGRPQEVHEWLHGVFRFSSSTLQQAEIFHRGDRDFGANLPPHATASAMLVDLLRNMIVCDVRDTLDIGLGSTMWNDEARIVGAPTRFGRLNVALEFDGEIARVRLSQALVPVRVRVPYETVAVEMVGSAGRVAAAKWIEAPAGVTEIVFRVETDEGRDD